MLLVLLVLLVLPVVLLGACALGSHWMMLGAGGASGLVAAFLPVVVLVVETEFAMRAPYPPVSSQGLAPLLDWLRV